MVPIDLYDDEGNKKTFYTKKEKKEREQNAAAAAIVTLLLFAFTALFGWIIKKTLFVFGVKKPTTFHYIIIFIFCFVFLFVLVTFFDFNEDSTKRKEPPKTNQINLLAGESKFQLMNRFKLFKKDKILISRKQFSDILDKNSPGRVHILQNYADSAIIINSTNNYRYIHFIEAGARFKMLDIAGASERIARGRIDLDIDHEDFIKNDRYQYDSKIRVRDKGYVAYWEVDPKDIQYEVHKLGVVIMQNSLAHFSQNNFKEYFIDSTTFFRFFPSSDLIMLFKKEFVKTNQSEEASDFCGSGRQTHKQTKSEGDDAHLTEVNISFPNNTVEISKGYDQIDSVNKMLLNTDLSRKEKRELKKFLNNPENVGVDFNILLQIDSVRDVLQNANLNRKEKKQSKKFIKQLENKIIYKNN